MTEEGDELELFLCFLCKKYKPVKKLKSILIRGEMWHRDICEDCLSRLEKEGGLSKEDARVTPATRGGDTTR